MYICIYVYIYIYDISNLRVNYTCVIDADIHSNVRDKVGVP